MNFKQRLNAAEKKAGVGQNVEFDVRHIVYENEVGGIDSEIIWGSLHIPGKPNSGVSVPAISGETRAAFYDRMEAECLKAFGELPRDWAAECAHAAL